MIHNNYGFIKRTKAAKFKMSRDNLLFCIADINVFHQKGDTTVSDIVYYNS